MAADERLHLEILALLLQVAWADDLVEGFESSHILKQARSAGLDDETIQRLDACLRGVATLPPPDLGFLRAHKDQAIAAVEHLVSGDDGGGSGEETESVIAEVRALLGFGGRT